MRRLIVLSDLTPVSLCQVNTHGAVVVGGKSFHCSASQTNSYYCSLIQPPLETGVCGDSVKKQLTICCTSKRGAKNGFKIVLGVICGWFWTRIFILITLSFVWMWKIMQRCIRGTCVGSFLDMD